MLTIYRNKEYVAAKTANFDDIAISVQTVWFGRWLGGVSAGGVRIKRAKMLILSVGAKMNTDKKQVIIDFVGSFQNKNDYSHQEVPTKIRN